jgi:putative membrane protein
VPDALFAAAAGSGGLAEVNVSKLGLERATDPELKQFSQRMIDDHTKVNQELANLTVRKGMLIPVGIDARARFCVESLSGLSGEEFNKCYAKAQLVLHMDAVAAFEAEAYRGQDLDIKALAAKALPAIKEHLQKIKLIATRYEK